MSTEKNDDGSSFLFGAGSEILDMHVDSASIEAMLLRAIS